MFNKNQETQIVNHKDSLECQISLAYEAYNSAYKRDLRSSGMSADAKRDMQACMSHVDYLLEQYFDKFVATQQIESD